MYEQLKLMLNHCCFFISYYTYTCNGVIFVTILVNFHKFEFGYHQQFTNSLDGCRSHNDYHTLHTTQFSFLMASKMLYCSQRIDN